MPPDNMAKPITTESLQQGLSGSRNGESSQSSSASSMFDDYLATSEDVNNAQPCRSPYVFNAHQLISDHERRAVTVHFKRCAVELYDHCNVLVRLVDLSEQSNELPFREELENLSKKSSQSIQWIAVHQEAVMAWKKQSRKLTDRAFPIQVIENKKELCLQIRHGPDLRLAFSDIQHLQDFLDTLTIYIKENLGLYQYVDHVGKVSLISAMIFNCHKNESL